MTRYKTPSIKKFILQAVPHASSARLLLRLCPENGGRVFYAELTGEGLRSILIACAESEPWLLHEALEKQLITRIVSEVSSVALRCEQ